MKFSQEPGFILHTYDYRETSLIAEVFTQNHGRISLVAKGARRWKRKGSRIYLKPFQEFRISWAGRGELATLTLAEEEGPIRMLNKEALYCGFYVNELMMRLLYRHDPHEDLYSYYRDCLEELSLGSHIEATLRLFEKRLMLEIGYGLNLDTDIDTGQAIDAMAKYDYHPNQGPTRLHEASTGLNQCIVSGKSLLAYRDEALEDPDVLAELKYLMRKVIDHRLNYRPLASRNIFVSNVHRGSRSDVQIARS